MLVIPAKAGGSEDSDPENTLAKHDLPGLIEKLRKFLRLTPGSKPLYQAAILLTQSWRILENTAFAVWWPKPYDMKQLNDALQQVL